MATPPARTPGPPAAGPEWPPRASGAAALRLLAARLHPVALGGALAIVCGGLLLTATNILVLKGGPQVGAHLGLLSQYLPGYDVSPAGSVLGMLYASAAGFALGWLAATLRNTLLSVYLWMLRLRTTLSQAYFLDRFD